MDPCALRMLLHYDPLTGCLKWRVRGVEWFASSATRSAEHVCALWNARYANREAFTCVNERGYKIGAVLGKTLKAHRVIWAIVHGYWPIEVDHEDGNTSNNRLLNLRHADRSNNMRNSKLRSNNKSDVVGVYWYARGNKWAASIRVNNRAYHLGYFADINDAIAARKIAEINNNFHKNHGRIISTAG